MRNPASRMPAWLRVISNKGKYYGRKLASRIGIGPRRKPYVSSGLQDLTVPSRKRAICESVTIQGQTYLKKNFVPTQVGMDCFGRELKAFELFAGRPWLPRLHSVGDNWLMMPRYPDRTRLDVIAPTLDRSDRLRICRQAMGVLFDIFLQGYAHCDFHVMNLFWLDGQLIVTDFETLQPYPPGLRPPFVESYDVTGEGLVSPFRTGKMSYVGNSQNDLALQDVLGISTKEALIELESILTMELTQACATFQTDRGRHTRKSDGIYASFSLPYFSVPSQVTQRNSARRFAAFSIDESILKGKSLLDLGSNTGAMIFEAQQYQPGPCVGVEYDQDKVKIATKIAAYNGLANVGFRPANIDHLDILDVGGKFDVVFCLAIEAHVENKARLYQLLGDVTHEVLYFEGNSTTSSAEVKASLLACGFKRVEDLGISDDDAIASNNQRPILVAYK